MGIRESWKRGKQVGKSLERIKQAESKVREVRERKPAGPIAKKFERGVLKAGQAVGALQQRAAPAVGKLQAARENIRRNAPIVREKIRRFQTGVQKFQARVGPVAQRMSANMQSSVGQIRQQYPQEEYSQPSMPQAVPIQGRRKLPDVRMPRGFYGLTIRPPKRKKFNFGDVL